MTLEDGLLRQSKMDLPRDCVNEKRKGSSFLNSNLGVRINSQSERTEVRKNPWERNSNEPLFLEGTPNGSGAH